MTTSNFTKTSNRKIRAYLFAFSAALVISFAASDFDFFSIFTIGNAAAGFLPETYPPDFSGLAVIIQLVADTFYMAFFGTLFGAIIALPVALLASDKVAAPKAIKLAANLLATGLRAVPDLVVAFLAVAILGIGPVSGLLAITVISVGVLGRLFTTVFDQVDRHIYESVLATGASKLQASISGLLPTAWPGLIAVALYRLDVNLRSSTYLGLVGAGGIGLLVRSNLGNLNYRGVLASVIVIFLILLLIELVAMAMRSDLRLVITRLFQGHAKQIAVVLRITVLPVIVFFAVLSLNYLFTQQSWQSNIVVGGVEILGQLLQPNFVSKFDKIVIGIFETAASAIIATFLGGLIGFPIALLASKNTSPSVWFYFLSRVLLIAKRGLPTLFIAIFFVAVMGFGPSAGIWALSLGSGAIFAKLCADSIEDVGISPKNTVLATGASSLQAITAGILPTAAPAIINHYFYTLDINLRYSSVLGIVGAGGVGHLLLSSVRAYDYQTASAVIILIFLLLVLLELAAKSFKRLFS